MFVHHNMLVKTKNKAACSINGMAYMQQGAMPPVATHLLKDSLLY